VKSTARHEKFRSSKYKLISSGPLQLRPKTETSIEPKVDVHQPKAKLKTSGEGHLTKEAANQRSPEASPDITKITVPKEAYATFRYIFLETREER
jgi:hypothetical protein